MARGEVGEGRGGEGRVGGINLSQDPWKPSPARADWVHAASWSRSPAAATAISANI